MSTSIVTPGAMPKGTGLRLGLGGIVALLGILVVVALLSPPGKRLIANPTGSPAQVGASGIVIRGDAEQNHIYDPPVVQVPAGTTVTWTFADRGANGAASLVPHDIVFEGFRSEIQADGTFRHTFDQPGSYGYFCSLHTFMNGRIEVVAQQ